nr:hypothetical protein BaRGS_001801 [Batillaria attramentaria]
MSAAETRSKQLSRATQFSPLTQSGLVTGRLGDDPQHTTDQAIVTRVKKAVKQLKKADVTLRQLVSDLAPVNVTRILMLPNITSQQLITALSTDPQTEQDLCQCVGATDTAAAVARCLCADSSEWWERSVTDHGQDPNMTDDIYERLVARFCGPATSVEVPTVTAPRRCMELRTETEAIAHTGLTMSILTLFPEQVALLDRAEQQQEMVFLWGPPVPGHTGGLPEDCERCADNMVNMLVELRVGQSGQDLQYRDTIVLCNRPRDDLAVVSRLRARGLPVQVVTSRDDDDAIRDVALALRDVVTVTEWRVVTGLERRAVVGMGPYSVSETRVSRVLNKALDVTVTSNKWVYRTAWALCAMVMATYAGFVRWLGRAFYRMFRRMFFVRVPRPDAMTKVLDEDREPVFEVNPDEGKVLLKERMPTHPGRHTLIVESVIPASATKKIRRSADFSVISSTNLIPERNAPTTRSQIRTWQAEVRGSGSKVRLKRLPICFKG